MAKDTLRVSIPHHFEPRDYQVPFWRAAVGDPGKGISPSHNRVACVWHRRAGKDKTFLNAFISHMTARVGFYPYYFPTQAQGRKILWKGMDKEGFPFLKHFPREMIRKQNDQEMIIELINGSIFQIMGTDRLEVVGMNPIGCVFSEFSLQNPEAWELIKPILVENGGFAWFNFTPRGKNHAYKVLRNGQRSDRWFTEVLTVNETKAVSLQAIQDEKDDGMPEDLIQQEFFCSFDLGIKGAYYATLMNDAWNAGRIGDIPHDRSKKVYTVWDLGWADPTAITFYQKDGQYYNIIDYYEDDGQAIAEYARVLDDKRREHGYHYGTHFAPHDVAKHSQTDGRSVFSAAKEAGLQFKKCKKEKTVGNAQYGGIERTRRFIPKLRWDQVKCKRLIEGMEGYRKQYNEKMQCYLDKPLHDWCSQPADTIRLMSQAVKIDEANYDKGYYAKLRSHFRVPA